MVIFSILFVKWPCGGAEGFFRKACPIIIYLDGKHSFLPPGLQSDLMAGETQGIRNHIVDHAMYQGPIQHDLNIRDPTNIHRELKLVLMR